MPPKVSKKYSLRPSLFIILEVFWGVQIYNLVKPEWKDYIVFAKVYTTPLPVYAQWFTQLYYSLELFCKFDVEQEVLQNQLNNMVAQLTMTSPVVFSVL